MRVEYFDCGRSQGKRGEGVEGAEGGAWTIREHDPELHPRRRGDREQPVI